MKTPAIKPGRAFTIEEIPDPIPAMGLTHRIIGHTLGAHLYVASLGSLEECEAEVRRMENGLRSYDFKVIEGGRP